MNRARRLLLVCASSVALFAGVALPAVAQVAPSDPWAQASSDMSQRLYEDAERARSEMSGVNLDEEAARLLQYQQAYQAAAKVLATANEMFRSLLNAAG